MHARASLRDHQVRARIPPVPAARTGKRARRVEPCDHGLESEADVRSESRLRGRFSLPSNMQTASNDASSLWTPPKEPSATKAGSGCEGAAGFATGYEMDNARQLTPSP